MSGDMSDAAAQAAYTERLVFTESTDTLPLEGAVIIPAAADLAVVWIHGGASKFYERHYVAIGRELATRGYAFVTGNTRGHDAFTLLVRGDDVTIGGASFERYDEAPRDVAAWVGLAMGLGVRGVVLAGHSLGASKVVHAQAQQQDPRVLGVIAASPAVRVPSNPDRVALAKQMVGEGRGAALLPHLEGTPAWNMVSAQTVLTRDQVIRHVFDSDDRPPDIAEIRCPVLVLYGAEEEVDAAGLDILRANARAASHVEVQSIEGAGHEYTGKEAQAADVIAGWLASSR